MSNVIDYVLANQYDSFYDKDFTMLDALALTELAYLPFEDLVPSRHSSPKAPSLKQLADLFEKKFQGKYPPLGMVSPHRLKLLSCFSTAKRYKQIRSLAFVNDYNQDSQKQFAALTYQIRPKEYLVVFRGTDDTLIGWKEDFHMTYMEEIPAQVSAKDYLNQILQEIDGKVWLAGHSKGGNLAIFAASHVSPEYQERIQEIYSFDGPGLHSSILSSKGYKDIERKVQAIIPENSIVGMMLEPPEADLIVKSKSIGLLQHNTFSWEIEEDHFKVVSKVKDDSIQVNQTLKTWTANLSQDELRDFFDLFFGIFIEAGILRFGDMTIDTSEKIQKVIQNRKNLSPEQVTMLERITKLLIDIRFQIWKEHLPNLTKLKRVHFSGQLPAQWNEKIATLSTIKSEKQGGSLADFNLQEKIRSFLADKNKGQS